MWLPCSTLKTTQFWTLPAGQGHSVLKGNRPGPFMVSLSNHERTAP